MATPEKDYSQVYLTLQKMERRISYLEKDSIFIEKKLSDLDVRKLKEFTSLIDELSRLHQEMSRLRNSFSVCLRVMSGLSKELKYTVKNEDIVQLNSSLDEITFEKYVTHKDLIRGV